MRLPSRFSWENLIHKFLCIPLHEPLRENIFVKRFLSYMSVGHGWIGSQQGLWWVDTSLQFQNEYIFLARGFHFQDFCLFIYYYFGFIIVSGLEILSLTSVYEELFFTFSLYCTWTCILDFWAEFKWDVRAMEGEFELLPFQPHTKLKNMASEGIYHSAQVIDLLKKIIYEKSLF